MEKNFNNPYPDLNSLNRTCGKYSLKVKGTLKELFPTEVILATIMKF